MPNHTHITLIGMPGAGKTTAGRLLAAHLGYQFYDTDREIVRRAGLPLHELIERDGANAFKKIEESAITTFTDQRLTIVSTGGSVVYSTPAMTHLTDISKIVFLDAPLELIELRLKNASTRGILGLQEKGLAALYAERRPLYEKYAAAQINVAADETPDQIMKKILRAV